MRASALHGQSTGSRLAAWVICSPLTAFFWSANVREARWMRFTSTSFKEASVAL